MKHLSVSALKTDLFNPVVQEYLNDPAVTSPLTDSSSTAEMIERVLKNFSSEQRSRLVEVLQDQYSRLKTSQKGKTIDKQLFLLSESSTCTIVTGQQIHPALGPLLVFYKILSCLDTAIKYKADHPDHDFVPIFWMATEDHDLAEVQRVTLYNDVFVWDTDQTGPVGRMETNALVTLMEQLDERVDDTPEHHDFLKICKECYSAHDNFADATREIVHRIFGEHGIVVLDPDDPRLKSLFVDHMQHDLIDHSLIKGIDDAKSIMKDRGYDIPINGRDINHFYIKDGLRERLDRSSDQWEVLNTDIKFSEEELKTELRTHPERFSPNALIRPMYQQHILPSVNYIAGGSEFMYWLELRKMFESEGVIYPHVQIRTSAFIIGENLVDQIEKSPLELKDFFLPNDDLVRLTEDTTGEALNNMRSATEALDNALANLKSIEAQTINNQGLGKAKRKLDEAIAIYKQILEDAVVEKAKDGEIVQKMLKIRKKLWGSSVQERKDCILRYIPELLGELQRDDRSQFHNPEQIQVLVKA